MLGSVEKAPAPESLDALDRVSIAYLTLPLVLFVAGWFEWWAAAPCLALTGLAMRRLWARSRPGAGAAPRVTRIHVAVAVIVGCAWTAFGGTDHLFFANFDWHIRDAVLHDLVVSPWPVGYGVHDGQDTLLRTSIAYYLPAALVGKIGGLAAAHAALAAWTAIGVMLFLMQVMSLTGTRLKGALAAAAVVVLFSGMDILGELVNAGPRFRQDWTLMTHIEWWAGSYQYSSMTTQLFWVPNHALGGWLFMGLLFRHEKDMRLDGLWPILLVAAALWSPLTALGLMPFVVWRGITIMRRSGLGNVLEPRGLIPALVVGVAIAGYLALDPGGVRKGVMVGAAGDTAMSLLRQVQFFLLEAGLLGMAILVTRRSVELILALAVLLLLPSFSLGPGNDLVMRAWIPGLVVLMVSALRAVLDDGMQPRARQARVAILVLLLVGAATPVAEFARAVELPSWPINMEATLIGADCGRYAPHYVAHLGDRPLRIILRPPHALDLGPQGPAQCDNPGLDLMWAHLTPHLRLESHVR